MKPSDPLSKDARALLRAARGGDDIAVGERQRVLQAFRQRIAIEDAAAITPGVSEARASRGRARPALPRPVRRLAWAMAALVSTGSLAALAHEGAFEGWGAAIERMFGALAAEPSTGRVQPPATTRPPQVASQRGVAEHAAEHGLAEHGVAEAAEPALELAETGAAGADPRDKAADVGMESARARGPDVPMAQTAGEHALARDESGTSPEAPASAQPAGRRWNQPMRPSPEVARALAPHASVRVTAAKRGQVGVARSETSSRGLGSAGAARSKPRAQAATDASAAARTKAAVPAPVATEELDLIVAARNALAARHHADARARAERHARQFPGGLFAEERDAILALCACRESNATERARAFIERRPDSLFAERIREDCKLASNLVPADVPAATHQESPPRSGAK